MCLPMKRDSVRAAREQRRQNQQVPWGEKPMFSSISKALGGACDKAQSMTLRKVVEMLGANPRKVCHLGISEDFLARFNGYHVLILTISKVPQISRMRIRFECFVRRKTFLAAPMVRTASTSKTPIQVERPGKKQSSASQARGCRRCLIRSSCLVGQTRGSPQQA